MKHLLIFLIIIITTCPLYAKEYDFSDSAYQKFKNEYNKIVIPPGESIHSRLNNDISSEQNNENDVIITQLINDWEYKGKMVAPEGSLIKGKISDIKNATYASGNAKIIINFDEIIRPDNTSIIIKSKPICVTIGDSRLVTASRHLLTGILSGVGFGVEPTSLAVSAAAGAISGGVVFITTKGQEVTIPFGTEFNINIINNINTIEYEN